MNRLIRLALVGLLVILTGCSSLPPINSDWLNQILYTPTPAPVKISTAAPHPTNATDSVTAQPTAENSEPNILRIWLPPQFNPNTNAPASVLLKQRLADFETEHPGLEIDIRIKAETGEADLLNALSITSMAAPSALPDLIALPRSGLEAAAQKGLIRPLEDLSSDLQKPDWYPYARDLGKVDGTVFGLPFAGDAQVIIYRPELVWIKNWDSILLSESHLVFAGADPQAQVGLALYVSAGGDLLDSQGKPTLDQDILTRVLELISKGRSAMIFPDSVENIAVEDQVMQEYRAHRSDMVIAHYSGFRSSQDGLLQPLMGLDEEHLTFATGWVWALAGVDTAKQQLSLELAEYLTADDFLAKWIDATGYLPTRPSAINSKDKESVTAIIDAAKLVPSEDILVTLGPLMQEAIVRVLNGEQPQPVARSVIQKLK